MNKLIFKSKYSKKIYKKYDVRLVLTVSCVMLTQSQSMLNSLVREFVMHNLLTLTDYIRTLFVQSNV